MEKNENIVRYSSDELMELARQSKTDWTRVMNMSQEEADANADSDPDDFTNDPEFWKNARLVFPVTKEKVSLRLDSDILDHFRQQGRGYQTMINAVLRAYVMRDDRPSS